MERQCLLQFIPVATRWAEPRLVREYRVALRARLKAIVLLARVSERDSD